MARQETVKRVIDGDTFETQSRQKPVRLANVDAPEKGGRGGRAATQKLKNLVEGESVLIETVARDKYGRAVANVKIGRESVNKAMNDYLKKK